MSKWKWLALSVTVLGLLAVLMSSSVTPASAATPTVQVYQDPALGKILVTSKGMTIYQFSLEKNGKSRCYGFCIKTWVPLTVAAGAKPTGGPGVTGTLGTFERSDGSAQVTYNNQPLYVYLKDTKPGDTVGQGHNNHFFVVPISGPAPQMTVPAAKPTASAGTPEAVASEAAAQEPALLLDQNAKLGDILVNPEGMTVYTFAQDTAGASACTADCAKLWPPLTVDKGVTPVADQGVTGKLGVIHRKDGSYQVTYDDAPLYLYSKDTKPGDAKGQPVKDWAVIKIVVPTVTLDQDRKLGNILVDANGMTLYTFKNDKAGESACAADCATLWPPLTVDKKAAKPVADQGVPGKLAVIERKDKTFQVTYDGQPLYLYSKDAKPGDTTGQGVKNLWNVIQVAAKPALAATVAPTAAAAKAAQPATVSLNKDAKLGNVLVDANSMTLYVYNKDKVGESNCTGVCAKAWPPLAVAQGSQPTAGTGIAANVTLGTLDRKDGITQVTFNGVPLYLYSKDAKPGDATGQGLKDWFVAQIK